MNFELGDLLLRPNEPRDCAAIVKYANNARVARQMRDKFPHPYTAADAEEWVSVSIEMGDQLAIEFDGEFIGNIGLLPGSDVGRLSAEVGYWLGEPFWGRGFATRVVAAVTERALEERFQRVFACVFEGNDGSGRVLEKAGFTYEGCLRKSVLKNGATLDQSVYARLASGLT